MDQVATPSANARRRLHAPGKAPWFLADWRDAVFVHWAVDPEVLQPFVPFTLDRWRGEAYVSVVAFTQRRLRPRFGDAATAWLTAPIATHAFCNLRTYVRVGDERGICFLHEWIPNRLALVLGPLTYGLPYRFGRLRYHADDRHGRYRQRVEAGDHRLAFDAFAGSGATRPVDALGRDHFLLERYNAFVRGGRGAYGFRIWHRPWPARVADIELIDDGLLAAQAPWLEGARLVGGHHSPGVDDVWIGRPAEVG
ncbi:MAG: DUF2071 domain-containing protein [Planctomycetes bacterium]|nr:DUF2071 domain-containing protein [Planctomycetota bacterium]